LQTAPAVPINLTQAVADHELRLEKVEHALAVQ
jgi:hypothetical protein